MEESKFIDKDKKYEKKGKSQLKGVWTRLKKDKLALIGLVILIILILMAIFANFIAPSNSVVKLGLFLTAKGILSLLLTVSKIWLIFILKSKFVSYNKSLILLK